MDPKRILLVTDLWFTHPNGVATVVAQVQKALQKKGHTVDVLEPSLFFGVPFPLYPQWKLPLFAWRGVERKIREGRYDYVHIETEAFLGLYARRACRRLGIPYTTSLHGQHHLYARKWLGRWAEVIVERLVKRFHAHSRAVVVSTPAMREQLQNAGFKNVEIRPLGVGDEFFTHGTCPVDLDRPVFIYMGRVSSEKSIEDFLSADLPGTKLVVGDGPDKARLERMFPNARFTGAQTGEALINWCSCGDVMVMPSRTETFGLSMVECLALGIPVAAYDVTGPHEIIQNGVNGYLGEDLAASAKKCLELSKEACTASVKKSSWSASADAFAEILRSANDRAGRAD